MEYECSQHIQVPVRQVFTVVSDEGHLPRSFPTAERVAINR